MEFKRKPKQTRQLDILGAFRKRKLDESRKPCFLNQMSENQAGAGRITLWIKC